MNFQDELINFSPTHRYFIGIDSDGCVFDSMEVKQKKYFIPNALKHFNLYSISDTLVETWEFVNLYSIYRGSNRFNSLVKVFELLSIDSEVVRSGCILPDMKALKEWINTESRLSNATLGKYLESNHNDDLEKILKWSEAINEEISGELRNITPFNNAIKAISSVSSVADLLIVSQTPLEALEREWKEHDLKKYVKVIAGQEHGTKSEHIGMAAKGKYPDNRILMIGDAKGDMDAAMNNGILFYPVIPGKENQSWEIFIYEGSEKFIKGTFSGEYQRKLIAEFLKSLPDSRKSSS